METLSRTAFGLFLFGMMLGGASQGLAQPQAAPQPGGQDIPLPEHPRPDFERSDWVNLNGTWAFRFDSTDAGLDAGRAEAPETFDREVTVPFPWGAPLSGLTDEAEIGWYAREITIPEGWEGKRVFLTKH